MTIKWGDPIECNGVRPDWLRDGTPCAIDQGRGLLDNDWPAEEWSWWCGILAFYLPADHPAYVALARGFTPWIGGESAPDDWSLDDTVLFRDLGESTGGPWIWSHDLEHPRDIIGYRKRVEYGAVHTDGSRSGGQPLAPEPVRIVPMTLDEWKTIQFHPGTTAWAHSVGLIRPESRAERFTRETGHVVTEAVQAALNWKGE